MRSSYRKALAIGGLTAGAVVGLCAAALMLRAPSPPNLVLAGLATNDSGVVAVICLTNSGPHSICYVGYETNSPWYSYRFQTPGGTTNYCPFFCGNGLREYVLRARQSVDFRADQIDQKEYQVCLSFALPSPLDKVRAIAPSWVWERLPQPRIYEITTPTLRTDRKE